MENLVQKTPLRSSPRLNIYQVQHVFFLKCHSQYYSGPEICSSSNIRNNLEKSTTRLCQPQHHISCDVSVGSPVSPPQTPGIRC